MSGTVWFPFYLGSYAKHAGHLTQAQHGAYLCLIRYYYTTKGPIPHAERHAIACAFASAERRNTDFILGKFFTRKGNFWHNSKADEVVDNMRAISKKRRESAQKSWAKRGDKSAEKRPCKSNAIALQTHMQTPCYLQSQKEKLEKEKPQRLALDGRAVAMAEVLAALEPRRKPPGTS